MKTLYEYCINYFNFSSAVIRSCLIHAESESDAKTEFFKLNPYGTIITVQRVYGGKKEVPDEKEDKEMKLTKKVTVCLTEDDVKEIIAEYVARELHTLVPKKEDIEFTYKVDILGPAHDSYSKARLTECKVVV